jgi:hypothetical protein
VVRGDLLGAPRLNPMIVVEGRECWLATHELFAIDRRVLGQSVTSLEDRRDMVIGALDFLFIGF